MMASISLWPSLAKLWNFKVIFKDERMTFLHLLPQIFAPHREVFCCLWLSGENEWIETGEPLQQQLLKCPG